jgi:hypothetical protein
VIVSKEFYARVCRRARQAQTVKPLERQSQVIRLGEAACMAFGGLAGSYQEIGETLLRELEKLGSCAAALGDKK